MVSRTVLYGAAGAAAAGIIAALALTSGWQEPEVPVQRDPDPSIVQLMEAPAASPQVTSMLLGGAYPALGHEDAPITLVEFGDYQCHFCHQFFENTEERIVSNYVETGMVKMVFRDFTIIGPDSITAAHGARCAEEQGLFWEYHDAVYSNWDGENTGWASLDGLRQYAGEAGADVGTWNGCMLTGAHHNKATTSSQAARDLGIGGTPAFFVIAPNGAVLRISGAQPYDVFQSVFDDIMAVSGAQPAVAP